MKKIKKSWVSRVVVIAFLFVAVQVPPVAVQIANRHPSNQVLVIAWMTLFIVLMLAVIWIARRTYLKYNELGKGRGLKLGWILGGFLVILLGSDILSALNMMIYHQGETANNAALGSLLGHNPIITIVFSFSAVVLSPIAEEFIFRGALTNMFFRPTRLWPKVILSGIVFSLGHASTNPISFLIYAFMGMVLAFVYLQSGDLKNSIAIHMANNLIATVALLMY